MSPIVDQSSDVILGHLRKLFLEDTFEAGQDDEALPFAIVIDDSKFDITISFLRDRRLGAEINISLILQ
jgi:hypothetical protein